MDPLTAGVMRLSTSKDIHIRLMSWIGMELARHMLTAPSPQAMIKGIPLTKTIQDAFP
jgi:hypothetical protein